ncbi:unnamed protein product [Arabidopsis thaliana]|uniref:(thale cress) hypothetical protein n=1 Tax=Arabidopsis thaliana TaxID=3702 RepID=A0A7G2FHL2_ARATH|nr:unnamed protein product [Arabidopsis thaliana]
MLLLRRSPSLTGTCFLGDLSGGLLPAMLLFPDPPPHIYIFFDVSHSQPHLSTFLISFSSDKAFSPSQPPLPNRLREPDAILKLFFTMVAPTIATQAVECNGTCLVVFTSSSLPLSCCQVMLLSCSMDCIHMSLVGRSLALVRSPTSYFSFFPGSISGIDYMKMVFLPLWQIGMPSFMSIPPLNLVDFSFMEYFVICLRIWHGSGMAFESLGSLQCIGIYCFEDMAWEVQSLFRVETSHLGTCRQILFPKVPLVWSGLDDQSSPVLKGFSSRLMVFFALIAEFVTLWVAMDAVT